MNGMATIGWLLHRGDAWKITSARASFGSAWAQSFPLLVFLGCLGLAASSFWFYFRWQSRGRRMIWITLSSLRATVLCLVLLILADPALELTLTSLPKPMLWILLDSSDSMSIPDELPEGERRSLANAVNLSGYLEAQSAEARSPKMSDNQQPLAAAQTLVRAEYVRAMLAKKPDNLVERLSESFQLRFFTFAETETVRALHPADLNTGANLAYEWQTAGTATALGDALEDLARAHATDNLAAVLIISDFDQNTGTAPLAAAKRLGVPVFTVGVGPLSAVDVSLELLVPPTMKKAERSSISVTVRQRELDHTTVQVRIYSHQSGEPQESEKGRALIGEKTLTIEGESSQVEFAYTPEVAGRFVFSAEIDPVAGEVVVQNNRAEREAKIIDDFVRVMFVEYEPTWEWRFMKEVFHRDKLVGTRGFRTFIRSADPVVRETNELFLPTLTLPRSQFFEHDVIFLGDMPASSLSTRFCEMTKEFVSQFGGGLVVMAGPRFGPGQLADTPLADMLPVVFDAESNRRDEKEFRLSLTPAAGQYDFMRLGQSDAENVKAWDNLGKLPWYQPARRVEARGTRVLAEHPHETCADGQTPQPLLAVRQYGRGEVVYLAFNEMWRLRRLHGEEFYRQFWGQLIHRLGLSHALGSHKRFVIRTDKARYRSNDQVLVTAEVYNNEFHPLDESEIPHRRLMADIIRPDQDVEGDRSQAFSMPQLKLGQFETRVQVFGAGEYRIQVTDPVTNEKTELVFDVDNVSIERRNPVRNALLQKNLAAETGGKAYDLTDVDQFPNDFRPIRHPETSIEIVSIWSNWLTFGTMLLLLIAEWSLRKVVNLT